MRELVVLHERAVDDRHAEVDVEQDRHRLQLAHDDVAENANERERSLRCACARRASSPTRALPLLAQPLERRLQHHAQRRGSDAAAMSSAIRRAAEPPVHGHPLARRDGERDGLRVAVEQVHVARPAGERARRVNAVADVLHAVRRVARDDAPLRLVVEAKRRNAVVLAVEDPRLAVRRRRRQPAEPAPQRVVLLAHHAARSSGSSPARSRDAAPRTRARRSAA